MSALRLPVRAHLERGEFARVLERAASGPGVPRALVSLLCDPDELVRWRAVSALGLLAGAEPGQVRPLVTRLHWSLNDESGGIGWMSAPALGEIGRGAPELVATVVRPLVRYLDEPFLLAGALWAIARLAPAFPAEVREVAAAVAECCGSPDAAVRAHAALALGAIGGPGARAALAPLAGDEAPARVYLDGELVTKRVCDWAAEALARLGGEPAPAATN